MSACGSEAPPGAPTPNPTGEIPTANVYILPGAVERGADAFGDHPVVIFTGERMRWRNVDVIEHTIVTDAAALPEFVTTGALAPGAERSFIMNTPGTTRIHCVDHPQMVGTLIIEPR